MKIELFKLYQYVFGDWADVEKHVKKDLEKTKRNAVIDIKKEDIKNLFTSVINKDKKPLFRSVLRNLKSTHLETLLYGNTTDELKENHVLATDDAIKTHFKRLEDKYNYFTDEKQSKNSLTQFTTLFKACQIVADLIELNNDPENSVAALHAYKILVIFNKFSTFEDYLNKYNFNKHYAPVHDALICPIPRKEKDNFHLAEWQKLIYKNAKKAMKLFNIAAAIEKQLAGRAPKNITEAEDAAQKVRYKQADKNPKLAKFCLQYNLEEGLFDKCLELEMNRKSRDNLPSVIIDGAEIARPGYQFVKLPIDDPRAFVLGHITSCCQSIGGHSEQCVIDGVTRENNGFYVLLKSKQDPEEKIEEKATPPLDAKGHINYAKYEIVGQGYAWLSRHHNLVFDSWENRTPGRDDPIIAPILEKFAQRVTHDEKLNIIRVLIGTGGKTPKICTQNITNCPEKIKEGVQYADSQVQSVIYCNEKLRQQFKADIAAALSQKKDDIPQEVSQNEFINWIFDRTYSKLLLQKVTQILLFAPAFLKQLGMKKNLNDAIKITDFSGVLSLFENNLLADEYPWVILKKKSDIESISRIYLALKSIHWSEHPIVTKGMAECSHRKDLKEMAAAIELLSTFDLHNNDVELFQHCLRLILKDLLGMHAYAKGYKILKELNLSSDPEIRAFLFKSEWWGRIANSFRLLAKHNLVQDRQLRDKIFSTDFHSESWVSGYLQLKDLNLHEDKEIRDIAFSESEYVVTNLASAFSILKKMNWENDLDLRKRILKELRVSSDQINLYAQLSEFKLENDLEMRDLVFNTSNNFDKILPAFTQLEKLHLENDSEIRKAIFDQLYSLDNLMSALTKLVEMNEVNNPIMRKVILHGSIVSPAYEDFLTFCEMLKKHHLHDNIIAVRYVEQIARNRTHGVNQQLSKDAIAILVKLKQMNLSDESAKEIADEIVHNEKNLKSLLDNFEKLSAAKLPLNTKMVGLIAYMLNKTCVDDVVAQLVNNPQEASKVIDGYLKLKQMNLDNLDDIYVLIGKRSYQYNSDEVASSFALLKDMKLENDDLLRKALLTDPIQFKQKMTVFSKLQELGQIDEIWDTLPERVAQEGSIFNKITNLTLFKNLNSFLNGDDAPAKHKQKKQGRKHR